MERSPNNIHGWGSQEELAGEVYTSNFRKLLEGSLVFAYRGQVWMVVTKVGPDKFRFGFIPNGSGYTCYYPQASYEYVRATLLQDLKASKTDKRIIEDFIYYIDLYGKN